MTSGKWEGPWFVTAAAIEDFMGIIGKDMDDPQQFHAAAAELRQICIEVINDQTKAPRIKGDREIWYAKRGALRMELVVSLRASDRGHADQLIAVTDRDRRR